MRYVWELSEEDEVAVDSPALLGKRTVSLNGTTIGPLRPRQPQSFTLSDGRSAEASWIRPFAGSAYPKLVIDGDLAIMTTEWTNRACDRCKGAVRPFDRHCDACGHELPTAQDQDAVRLVGQARSTIKWLGVLFALSGVLFYLGQLGTTETALAGLEGMPPDAVLDPIEGQVYTVAELRSLIQWESWSILVFNLGLAATMAGLFFWAKRSAFAAILTAAAVYAAVIVTNAIIDPATIPQGFLIKGIVILFLARGIKSELHLRARSG